MVAVVVLTMTGCGDNGATPKPDAKVDVTDGGCEPGPDAAPSGKPLGDVSGTWAIVEISHALVTGPLSSVQISRELYTYTVTQTGQDLQIVEQICDIHVDSEDDSEHTRFLPSLWANLPAVNRLGKLVDGGGGVFTFTTEKTYRTRGITMTDPAVDPMPDTDSGVTDPRVEDWDMDSHPGITLLLSGILRGQAYVVQRDFNVYNGKQSSPDQMEGITTWGSDQTYIGSDPDAIAKLNISASPDGAHPERDTFMLVRVPAGSNCAFVVANQCQLFNGK